MVLHRLADMALIGGSRVEILKIIKNYKTRLFKSQVGMFKLTRSRQLAMVRPYSSAQENGRQTEKGLKKYWNSFKIVMTDSFNKEVNLPVIEKLVKRKNLENALKKILQLPLQKILSDFGRTWNGKNNLGSKYHLKPPRAKEQDDHSEYSNWNLLSMQLLNTAYYYMKEYKHPIVLVLDQVDRIAKDDPKLLGILQDFFFAKDCADRGTLVIVFIASDGLVPRVMKSLSAWSRAKIPFKVGNISDDEAMEFLQDSGIDKKNAEDVVKYLTGGLIVGGRINFTNYYGYGIAVFFAVIAMSRKAVKP
ncbi:hypothetical protein C2G38_2151768 [Gigaspora rosea]|uniref:Uncharacterized protein n=1 Tax=Gigaspora rosea TaxID=44941 RepID=A0A397W9B6_9GLOM|nr:hypothetical protein C2G38_2151768 [Gigaspora rosea]